MAFQPTGERAAARALILQDGLAAGLSVAETTAHAARYEVRAMLEYVLLLLRCSVRPCAREALARAGVVADSEVGPGRGETDGPYGGRRRAGPDGATDWVDMRVLPEVAGSAGGSDRHSPRQKRAAVRWAPRRPRARFCSLSEEFEHVPKHGRSGRARFAAGQALWSSLAGRCGPAADSRMSRQLSVEAMHRCSVA